MATLHQTRAEIKRRNDDFDGVRRERIKAVETISGRPLVIYATSFLQVDKASIPLVASGIGIDEYDRIGFDEVLNGIDGPNLDVLLHSPGGAPEAAESIVHLLRTRFNHIRFIVPHLAKSAATMICCAGNEILMDERGELGPIDPQMRMQRGNNVINAPAQAVLDQFDKAKDMLAKNPDQLPAWLPLLEPLAPALLTQCEAANELSHSLVKTWLMTYMLAGETGAEERATEAARYLGDSRRHLSHGRRIGIDELLAKGLKVTDLRGLPELRSSIWDLYQAIHWTLEETGAFKIIEHSATQVYIRSVQQVQLQLPPGSALPTPNIGPSRPIGLPPQPGPKTSHPRRR